jgi:hypothetical protein
VAHKHTVTAGYFSVTSLCRLGQKSVGDITLGSSNVEHVIEVENGSTLPYNVSVDTILPDSPPLKVGGSKTLEFVHGSLPPQPWWQTEITQLASGNSQSDSALLKCTSSQRRKVRIQSPIIKYRLGDSVNWEDDPSAVLLTIEMNIV